MAASALLVMIFLRSTAITTNDLGHRSALVLQFVLLLWTAIYLAEKGLKSRRFPKRRTLFSLIISWRRIFSYTNWSYSVHIRFWQNGTAGEAIL